MTNLNTVPTEAAASRSATFVAAFGAILLGAFLVLGAGFSHSSTIHNAAHDVRHANAFPCH